MKTTVLLVLALFALASCKNDLENLPVDVHKALPGDSVVSKNAIPDRAAFRIKLVKDSTDYDETMLMFDHRSGFTYNPDKDAAYLAGFGQVSLASISSDGQDMSVYSLPYVSGLTVGLDVRTQTDGSFALQISYESKIPANKEILIRDTYLKDSIDVRQGIYNFTIDKADTNSFGNKRFKLVVRDGGQQQTGAPN